MRGAQRAEDRRRDEGEARRRREGEVQGRRAMMRALLEERFGVLPAAVVRRVDAASEDELAGWLRRALSARTLAEVFGDA